MPNAAVSTIPATASPAERAGAEVADDRGVGEDVERLGHQRAERREREAQDLAVVGAGSGG